MMGRPAQTGRPLHASSTGATLVNISMRDTPVSDSDHPDSQKRTFLKKLVWAAPLVVATASVHARAAQATGNGCTPNEVCPPDL